MANYPERRKQPTLHHFAPGLPSKCGARTTAGGVPASRLPKSCSGRTKWLGTCCVASLTGASSQRSFPPLTSSPVALPADPLTSQEVVGVNGSVTEAKTSSR